MENESELSYRVKEASFVMSEYCPITHEVDEYLVVSAEFAQSLEEEIISLREKLGLCISKHAQYHKSPE